MSGQWKHGLFECCDDPGYCVKAYFCFPCYICDTAEAAGENGCLHCIFPPLLLCLRCKVREQKNIEGSNCKDCCTGYLCGFCSVIQIKREFE